jgi:two-component system, cell cycle sensor histidine kinase DivJ
VTTNAASEDLAVSGHANADRAVETAAVWGAIGWTIAAAVFALIGWNQLPQSAPVAYALVAAVIPALVTLLLAPRLGETWAQVLAIYSWVAFSAVGAAFTGGLLSPMAACFVAAPALARLLEKPAIAAEASMFAALGYVAAGAASMLVEPIRLPLDPLPAMAATAAVVLSGYWFAGHARAARDATGLGAGLALRAPVMRLSAAGVVEQIAPAAAQRLGLDPRAAIGADLLDLLAKRTRPAERSALERALAAAGRDGAAYLDFAPQIGGARRPLALEIIGDAAGCDVAVVEAGRWAGRMQALRQDALAARAATTARSRQVAELSHELRTPLTHILGFAEIMQRQLYGPLSAKYVEYVELIQKSGRNLLELIGGLMDLSRLEGGRYTIERDRFDARDLIAEVVRLSAETANAKGMSLNADVPATALSVDADPRAVRQILINLVTNALKFTPAGGRVDVRGRLEAGVLAIEVDDTGPGITPGERARLGEAFERGAASDGVEGVGLGLALVRGFAALHGGALSFAERPGGGARVRVTIPPPFE